MRTTVVSLAACLVAGSLVASAQDAAPAASLDDIKVRMETKQAELRTAEQAYKALEQQADKTAGLDAEMQAMKDAEKALQEYEKAGGVFAAERGAAEEAAKVRDAKIMEKVRLDPAFELAYTQYKELMERRLALELKASENEQRAKWYGLSKADQSALYEARDAARKESMELGAEEKPLVERIRAAEGPARDRLQKEDAEVMDAMAAAKAAQAAFEEARKADTQWATLREAADAAKKAYEQKRNDARSANPELSEKKVAVDALKNEFRQLEREYKDAKSAQ